RAEMEERVEMTPDDVLALEDRGDEVVTKEDVSPPCVGRGPRVRFGPRAIPEVEDPIVKRGEGVPLAVVRREDDVAKLRRSTARPVCGRPFRDGGFLHAGRGPQLSPRASSALQIPGPRAAMKRKAKQ